MLLEQIAAMVDDGMAVEFAGYPLEPDELLVTVTSPSFRCRRRVVRGDGEVGAVAHLQVMAEDVRGAERDAAELVEGVGGSA